MNYIEIIGFICNQLFNDLADPRTNNWFLVRNPLPIFSIAIAYNFFVLGLGPKYMSHRKPFNLRKILIIYNALQVFLSMYIFYDGFIAYLYRYSLRCEPVDSTWSEEALRAARGCYIYYIAKVTELMDTVFLILRNKYDQVTFLHVYHHTIMPLISWGNVKYFPGGHGVFIGMINSFVNIIMYVYYMIAAMGPNYQKYVWWKKHITILQMYYYSLTRLTSHELRIGNTAPADCGAGTSGILLFMGEPYSSCRNGIVLIVFLVEFFIRLPTTFIKCSGAITRMDQDFVFECGLLLITIEVQMGVTFFHSSQLLFIDCGYPRWTILFTMPNAVLFMILFNDFYKNIHGVTKKILVRVNH